MASYILILPILFSMKYITNGQIIQCTDASCNCPSTATPGDICTLQCTESSTCSQRTINCRPNDPCQIICNANNACSNLTINANDATDLTVICATTNACTNVIHTSCETTKCKLQCNGNNSCINLSYSSNNNHIISNPNQSTFDTSFLNTTNPTMVIIILIIICCVIVFVSTGFNFLYYKTIKVRNQLVIQQYTNNNKIQSNSVITPSMRTASPLSPISQEVSLSPFNIAKLNTANSLSPKLVLKTLVNSNETNGDYYNDNDIDTEPIQDLEPCTIDNSNIHAGMHSSTYSQLPLSMRQPEFDFRMDNHVTSEPMGEEESISISMTNSYRL